MVRRRSFNGERAKTVRVRADLRDDNQSFCRGPLRHSDKLPKQWSLPNLAWYRQWGQSTHKKSSSDPKTCFRYLETGPCKGLQIKGQAASELSFRLLCHLVLQS